MIRHVNKDIGKATIAELKEEIRQLKYQDQRQRKLLSKIANGEEYPSWELTKYKK